MKITKQYIQENLFRSNGGLNNRRTIKLNETIEELYLIFHNTTAPRCKCGNKVIFKNFNMGYNTFCSVQCSSNDKNWKERVRLTNEAKTPEEKEVARVKARATKLKNHGDANYNNSKQRIETNLKIGVLKM